MFFKSIKWMGSTKNNMKQINLCMCHVNTNEITGSQGVSNYSINDNIEGVAIPMDIDTRNAVTLLKKQDILRL